MPDLIEQLAETLGIPVRVQGALRLIRLQDCSRIIEACKSSKLLIVGIDAFTLTEDKVFPDMNLIADFSGLVSEQWEWDAACLEAALSAEIYFGRAEGRTDLWFDFSCRAADHS